MTPDRVIALVAAIAALVSAIAALMVVGQASLQRKLSYKPQVVFNPQSFTYKLKNNKNDIFNRIHLKRSNNTHLNKSNLAINIGLGAALDVVIHWEYEYQKSVDTINSYFSKLERPAKISLYDNEITIDNADPEIGYQFASRYGEDTHDYILSFNQNPAPTEILVPFPCISLNCAILIYSLSAEGKVNRDLPKLTLTISYKDIGGSKFKEEYDIEVDFYNIVNNDDDILMNGKIIFNKIGIKEKTAKGLEGIRKRYAEFINEKDFNKNSIL
ncbi:MAG: hypothetical protein RR962_18500 [Hafnia sp.]